jgi:biopolymer transport protein ExbD
MNFGSSSDEASRGFPMAPMIDVVFLLLCFFITTQIFSQWETEINITLPTARTGESPQRLPGEIIVNIRRDGETSVNQRVLTEEELGVLLRDLAGLYPGQPVLLRADRQAAYEYVVRVLDLCREADIWNIAFATNVPET